MAKLRIKKGTHALNRSLGGDIAINTILIIFGAFMFIPMFYAIIQSLKPLDELWVFPPRFFVVNPTMKNYGDLFRLMSTSWVPFSRYIFNTILISVIGTFGNLMFASICAYALKKVKMPGAAMMFRLVTLSLMFNATVTGITNFLTMSFLGWIDTYLAIIIPTFCSTLGLYLMGQFIDSSIPDSVVESARLDGAGEFKTYWYIAMPMVKPAWLTLIIFSFQGLWNYGESIFIQSEQLKTFSYAIGQVLAGGIVRAGAGAASTVIMMVVPIAVFVVSQSNIIETMATSGMKD
jgi:ABC-type glycerol-3-phosphate transport system permease component